LPRRPHRHCYVTIVSQNGTIVCSTALFDEYTPEEIHGTRITDWHPDNTAHFHRASSSLSPFTVRNVAAIRGGDLPLVTQWVPTHATPDVWIILKTFISFPGFNILSVSEVAILKELVRSKTTGATADAMSVSHRTIERRISDIRNTTESSSLQDLIWRASLEFREF